MRDVIDRVQVAWWMIVVAVLGFYVAGLVMSVFDPIELWLFTAIVVILIALFARHMARVSRVLRDENAPGHDELRRTLNRMRESRGF